MRLDRDYIEEIFYNYEQIKNIVEAARRDPKGNRLNPNSGGRIVSDPTAIKAINQASPLRAVILRAKARREETLIEPEKWLYVVESTYRFFAGKDTADVLRRRFDGEKYGKTCDDLNISKSIYYCYFNEGMHYAELCAVGLGLMTPFR